MRRIAWTGAILTALAVLCFAGVATAQEAPPTAGEAKSIDAWDWFVVKGGPIGWTLIFINFASWALIITYLISIRRATVLPEPVRGQIGTMLESKQYREMIEYTSVEPSFLSYVVHQAVAEASHGYSSMERALEEAAEERTTNLLRRIEWLNIIGNVSPMMGLLGTVYGMIKVFSKIVQEQGMPEAAKLADGVGTALVTTFWGLIVAIPALAVYAWMRNRIDGLSTEAMMSAQEVISTFRPGAKKVAAEDPANSDEA
jgi:biopolymer transport protein ExbB